MKTAALLQVAFQELAAVRPAPRARSKLGAGSLAWSLEAAGRRFPRKWRRPACVMTVESRPLGSDIRGAQSIG